MLGRGESSMSSILEGLWPNGTWYNLRGPSINSQPPCAAPSLPNSNIIELNIGLPPYRNSRFPPALSVKMSENMNVGELNRQLAEELKVSTTRWKLLVFNRLKGYQVINDKEEIKSFQNNKEGQLVFAPAIRVR